MDDLYREQILDHYRHPRNFGKLKKTNAKAEDELVSCGDKYNLELWIDPKTKKVKNIGFSGTGCAISMASASLLSEYIQDKPISALQRLGKDDILRLLGINPTPTRLKCALLSLEILQKALQNYGKV